MFGLRLKVHNKAYTWIYPLLLVALLVTSRGYSNTPGCIHCERVIQGAKKFGPNEVAKTVTSLGLISASGILAWTKTNSAIKAKAPWWHPFILDLFYLKTAESLLREFERSSFTVSHANDINDKDKPYMIVCSACDVHGHLYMDSRALPPWYLLAMDAALLYGSSYVNFGKKPVR